ncbi:PREDICTED: uncharacterized protein LOC107349807 [Acropora digitifera]|uniref:uncharacterized protein LOC107349807 n=1 Tax=Acropora digitifera TaxID=70779 RepID=UPI00077B1763|nr:PREDICTED: uncharacterized protein LOC107349807 [Acropora digitifera]
MADLYHVIVYCTRPIESSKGNLQIEPYSSSLAMILFELVSIIFAIHFLHFISHHQVQADKNCSQLTNATCDDCIKEGCTYCDSTKTCMKFDLFADILQNKCPGQEWKFKQCLVNGKFILIIVSVLLVAVLVSCIICCCCGCDTFCRCIRCLCLYCFCCCCCSSGSSGKRRARVRRPMTQGAARRIQSAAARALGGMVPKGSFAARAQSIADRRAYGSID